MLEVEKQGFKTLKQIVLECGKQNVVTAKEFCKSNNLEADYSFDFARGVINYFSPEKIKVIKDYISKSKNELNNLKRNDELNGKSRNELLKKYNVSYKTAVKNGLITEEDFIDYVEQRNNRPLSPVTLCKHEEIRFTTFKSYNPGVEPTIENIKKFAQIYKQLSNEEKKNHRAKLMSENNLLHPEWQEKARQVLNNMPEDEKRENVRKCFESRNKNKTAGFNGHAKYLYKENRYNLTELCYQLEHPEWERLTDFYITYEQNKRNKHYYPDFRDINTDRLIEIKGRHLITFDDDNNWYLINTSTKERQLEKTNCLKKNNVLLIITNSEETKQIVKKWKNKAMEYIDLDIGHYITSDRKGKKFTDAEKQSFRERNCKPIICLEFPNEIFYGYTAASERTGVNNTVIKNYLSGKTKKIKKGFTFMYLEDFLKNKND